MSLLQKAQYVLDMATRGGAFDGLSEEECRIHAQAMLDGFGVFGLKVSVGTYWVKARLTKGGRKRLKKAERTRQIRAARMSAKTPPDRALADRRDGADRRRR